jgi:hypothetical protein
VQILANAIHMIAKEGYPVDCVYVLANHDNDSSWHASRELALMFEGAPDVNIIVDKFPHHYVEWGNVLIEITHENIKSDRGVTVMPVVARQAWGRTAYHYSVGGHLHGQYMTKEKNGVVMFGSRSLSDTDEWHYLSDYVMNLRGIEAYLFNKETGNFAAFSANIVPISQLETPQIAN